MQNTRIVKIIIFVTIAVAGCLEPYEPPTGGENPKYLIADAFLNTTDNSITVKLSYTIPLNSNLSPEPERYATVEFQDEDGFSVPLWSDGNGGYFLQGNFFNPEKKCRIHIITGGNKEYVSDFISITETPPVDSVSYSVEDDWVEINVNTHDDSQQSRFYRWTYVETWEYRSNYASGWILENGTPRLRPSELDIHTCWRTDTLKKIIIGTSNLLSQDVISNFNLLSIHRSELRLSRKYSILVQQHTLTEDAYEYWLNVQKTTENLGGLFDPMPGQVSGNIHSTKNPNDQVIGYFSAGSVSEQRIFITPEDLPDDFTNYRGPFCPLDTILVENLESVWDPDALISPVYPPGFPVIIGFTTSEQTCIDCRDLAGGIPVKPYFWE
jgi:hypothetical protein